MITQNERSVFKMDGLSQDEIKLLLIYKAVMQEEYHLTLEKIKEKTTTIEQSYFFINYGFLIIVMTINLQIIKLFLPN